MKTLISIIRAVLHDEPLSVKIDENLLSLAKFHSVAQFLYPCMDQAQTDPSIVRNVTEIYYTAVKRDAVQQCEREELEADFEKSQIPYLPLKGMIMKSFYPQSHLRTMGDLDYLVAPKHFSAARKIILNHGYTQKDNCEHHIECEKPPIMVVELHRKLFTSQDLGESLFTDVLDRCKKSKEFLNRLEMTDEDFYLHLMLHLIKHYVSGGTGLRSFIDIYLYIKAKPDMDREYLNAAFAKTEYAGTAALIERFSSDLFEGSALDEEELSMLDRVVNSGTYGTIANKSQSDLQNFNNSTFKVVMRKLFPTVKIMKDWYPVLGKGAGILLLPVFYVWHVLTRLFNFKKSFKRFSELVRAKKRNRKNNP
ncbi:MAG: nucleotidyltransferase family protein [Candidatus Coproplasma sp.]